MQLVLRPAGGRATAGVLAATAAALCAPTAAFASDGGLAEIMSGFGTTLGRIAASVHDVPDLLQSLDLDSTGAVGALVLAGCMTLRTLGLLFARPSRGREVQTW